jgi:hypothetical protein
VCRPHLRSSSIGRRAPAIAQKFPKPCKPTDSKPRARRAKGTKRKRECSAINEPQVPFFGPCLFVFLSQVKSRLKFILPTKINNTAPPLVSGAGSSRAAGKSGCHFGVFEIIRNCCHECRLRVPSTECIPSHLPSPEVSLSRRLSICGPASPRCGYWANWGFFYSAPQDLVVLGVFCARFPPREANIHSAAERRAKILGQPCMQP